MPDVELLSEAQERALETRDLIESEQVTVGWSPKAVGAGAGASVTGAATVILVWIAGTAGVDVPPEVASSFTTLLSALGGLLGARLAKPGTVVR